MNFLDLSQEVKLLRKNESSLNNDLPIALYAFGGIPITTNKENELIFSGEVIANNELVDDYIFFNYLIQGLGTSGLLTYLNPSDYEIEYLGSICKKKEHEWAYNWMTLSFLIYDETGKVEQSFLRSSKFYTSWTVNKKHNCFGVSGSIKNFKKFVKYKDDTSFDKETREIMTIINVNYLKLWA